jgi:hypothetical protein
MKETSNGNENSLKPIADGNNLFLLNEHEITEYRKFAGYVIWPALVAALGLVLWLLY